MCFNEINAIDMDRTLKEVLCDTIRRIESDYRTAAIQELESEWQEAVINGRSSGMPPYSVIHPDGNSSLQNALCRQGGARKMAGLYEDRRPGHDVIGAGAWNDARELAAAGIFQQNVLKHEINELADVPTLRNQVVGLQQVYDGLEQPKRAHIDRFINLAKRYNLQQLQHQLDPDIDLTADQSRAIVQSLYDEEVKLKNSDPEKSKELLNKARSVPGNGGIILFHKVSALDRELSGQPIPDSVKKNMALIAKLEAAGKRYVTEEEYRKESTEDSKEDLKEDSKEDLKEDPKEDLKEDPKEEARMKVIFQD
jgi:hypothetical protein